MNRWSCLPKAAAIAADVPFEKILEKIGHDGSEILWPDLPGKYQRRSFHTQEIVLALLDLGFTATPLYAEMTIGNRLNGRHYVAKTDLTRFLDKKGILIGMFGNNPHAAAFDSGIIHDPQGSSYPYHDAIRIEEIWLIESNH